MPISKPGCVYCGFDHDARKCNYQLIWLIESYLDKHVDVNAYDLASEIAKAGYKRAKI